MGGLTRIGLPQDQVAASTERNSHALLDKPTEFRWSEGRSWQACCGVYLERLKALGHQSKPPSLRVDTCMLRLTRNAKESMPERRQEMPGNSLERLIGEDGPNELYKRLMSAQLQQRNAKIVG